MIVSAGNTSAPPNSMLFFFHPPSHQNRNRMELQTLSWHMALHQLLRSQMFKASPPRPTPSSQHRSATNNAIREAVVAAETPPQEDVTGKYTVTLSQPAVRPNSFQTASPTKQLMDALVLSLQSKPSAQRTVYYERILSESGLRNSASDASEGRDLFASPQRPQYPLLLRSILQR